MRKEISEENLTSSCLSRYDAISDILDKRTRSSLSLARIGPVLHVSTYVHRDLGTRRLGVRGEHCKQDYHVHTSLDTSSLWGSPGVHITMGITQCARRLTRHLFWRTVCKSSFLDVQCARHVTRHLFADTQCTRHLTRHPFGIPTVRGFDATLGAVGCILGTVRPWREGVLEIRA
jgi:hypothetical protein